MSKRKNTGKPRLRAILQVPKTVEAISEILLDSEKKYGPVEERGWMDYDPKETIDSMMRHMVALESGEIVDPESGRPHTWHIATNAAILIEITSDVSFPSSNSRSRKK